MMTLSYRILFNSSCQKKKERSYNISLNHAVNFSSSSFSSKKGCRWEWATLFGAAILLAFWASWLINIFTSGEVFNHYYFIYDMDVGMDFFNSMIYTNGRNPYLEYSTLYPPLANLFFYLLQCTVPRSLVLNWPTSEWPEMWAHRGQWMDLRVHSSTLLPFLFFVILTFVGIYSLTYRLAKRYCSHPTLFSVCFIFTSAAVFSVDRGNIILLSVLASLFFLCYWKDDRPWLRELALIALAFSAGLKLYPAFLGILLLRERQWKRAARTVGYGLFFFIAPFFAFHGFQSMSVFFSVLFGFNNYSNVGTPGGVSGQQIANSLMLLAGVENRLPLLSLVKWLCYLLLVVGAFLCFVWQTHWKPVAILSLMMILVPGQSVNYTILNLLVPAVLFFTDQAHAGRWKGWYTVLFFFLFAVLPWPNGGLLGNFYAEHHYGASDLVIQLSLVALLFTLLADGLVEFLFARHKSLPALSCVLSQEGRVL